MNFILKLAYLYKVTEKKRLIYMHLLLLLFIVLCGLPIPGPQERRKLILPGSVVHAVYIISKKKRPVYMHIVIYIVIW